MSITVNNKIVSKYVYSKRYFINSLRIVDALTIHNIIEVKYFHIFQDGIFLGTCRNKENLREIENKLNLVEKYSELQKILNILIHFSMKFLENPENPENLLEDCIYKYITVDKILNADKENEFKQLF